MSEPRLTMTRIAEHVQRLGEKYPPIPLDSVDRTINRPAEVTQRFGPIIDYLARVELEVDRNVLELLLLLPDQDDVNRMFYADVWQPQEIHHGLILDRLQQDLGREAAVPELDVDYALRLTGLMAHIGPMQEVIKMMYYLTGAATERQAVLAYNHLTEGLKDLGEEAIARTIIAPIKQQEPGHFAFYKMQAELMIQDGVLAPWQLLMIRTLRKKTFSLVGVNHNKANAADLGGVIVGLGFADDLVKFAREVGRVESQLLWAQDQGMEVPGYILKMMREAVLLYHERGFSRPNPPQAQSTLPTS